MPLPPGTDGTSVEHGLDIVFIDRDYRVEAGDFGRLRMMFANIEGKLLEEFDELHR